MRQVTKSDFGHYKSQQVKYMGKILHFIAKETQGECFTSRMSNNTFIDTTFDNLNEIIIIE